MESVFYKLEYGSVKLSRVFFLKKKRSERERAEISLKELFVPRASCKMQSFIPLLKGAQSLEYIYI